MNAAGINTMNDIRDLSPKNCKHWPMQGKAAEK